MNLDAQLATGGASGLHAASEPSGIAVFFIDARAVAAGLKSTLIELLEDQGHEALYVTDLNQVQAEAAARLSTRGDGPAAAVVAIDLLPMKVDVEQTRKYPGFDNPKIAKALERARHLAGTQFDDRGAFVLLTATRTSADAWQAVRLLFPERETALRASAERMRADLATHDAIRDLTREGRRAKVELVKFRGGLAIRKTYRASALRYMQREIEVLERLSPIRPELPRLLDRGARHIVTSYIEDGQNLALEHRGGRPSPLPLKVVRSLAEFIKACVAQGFDPIDLRAPGNVMHTDSGLKVIDFELWRHCSREMRAEDALCLRGVPASDTERPRGVPAFAKSYAEAWYPLTLLSVESFLHDPPWLQQLKRATNLLRFWGPRAARGVARRLRERVSRAPRGNPRYIPAHLGVSGVLAEFNRRNVRYVVLRWFDRLPELGGGGDLDVLVHDDDVSEVDDVLDARSGIAECDVYSVSGTAGTTYSGVPHILPAKAARLLESATWSKGCRVPALEDHFLSLAFHSVYHKGFKSGLPSGHEAPAGIPTPKNDYAGTLAALAAELGVDVDVTLEALHDYLVSRGWGATPEMLTALSRRNAWIPAHLGVRQA